MAALLSGPRLRGAAPLVGIALLGFVLGGCSAGPPPLEIVPADAPVEAPPPPRFLLELRVSGAVEVPLPPNDASQRIESLFWVVPRGDYELVEAEGRRLLKTSAEAALELRLRFALTERDLPQVPPALASQLSTPPGSEDPNRRWASGFDWSGEAPRLRRWTEVKIDDQWWPYDPARGALIPRAETLSFADSSSRGLEEAAVEIKAVADDLATSTPEEPAAPTPRGS